MLHVLDSPSPSLQSLLSPSLTVRKDVRAYADAITKFSRIDRFPFSRPMKSPLLRWTQQIGLLSMYGFSWLGWWSTAALPRRPWVRIPLEPWSFDCHWRYSNLIKICNTARHIILTINLTVFVEFCLNIFVGAITATEKKTYDNFNCVYVELSLTASSIAV